jgi:hypothetical protein
MTNRYVPVPPGSWLKGDYRYAASIKRSAWTIEALAARIGAELEEFEEDGLGLGKAFGARSTITGRQIAFDYFEAGQEGPNLLVLFEDDICCRSEVLHALEQFGVDMSDVYWLTPQMSRS